MKTIFITTILALAIAGCAEVPSAPVATMPLPKPYPEGVYHIVLKGQTLWRIAKAYDTDINKIVSINKISDPAKIEEGQMVFIPNVKERIQSQLPDYIEQPSAKGYLWPAKGRVISYYGSKSNGVANKGIDIETKEGQVISASRAGKVVFCDNKVKGLGKCIIIEHNNGYSTLYAYNSQNLVKCGDIVTQGAPIARAGSTGRAKRPSLHFEIRKGHRPQNPFYYLP